MTTTAGSGLRAQAVQARTASRILARARTEQKNTALANIAAALRTQRDAIVTANAADVQADKVDGTDPSLLDRIRLTPQRVEALAAAVETVIRLPDPVGENLDQRLLPSGLTVGRVRVPLGVIASIYENRPNVTVDIAVLCLKSGNACILRGGKEAIRSNSILAGAIREAVSAAGLPAEAVQLIASTDRALVAELLAMDDLIDLMLPRGSAALIQRVRKEARMPVVAGGVGICHTYVDRAADLEMALAVVDNAKTRRVSICNALDVLLVHQDVAGPFLRDLAGRWREKGVQVRADPAALNLLADSGMDAVHAVPADFDTEFLALVAAVHVVADADAALEHIAEHGSGHSEAILTNDYVLAERFLKEVDAAAVFVNTSTQFNDGGEFGLGAEVGISTGKLHARGPMGLRELTSYKWIVRGQGQIRPV